MTGEPPEVNKARGTAPPWWFWLIPLAVATLQSIPFILTRIVTPAGGSILPPVGYNPIDSLAYVSFIREASTTGDWLLANPHTTLPQGGRYILPLFALLGHICRWTGVNPFLALELSRTPLIFVFFALLWLFLTRVLPQTRERLAAIVLIAFSGGLELFIWITVEHWPPHLGSVLSESLSDDQGWNAYASLRNPLWIAGLCLALITLRPVLLPEGEQEARDWWQLGVGMLATYLVHPYSGLVVICAVICVPVLRWVLGIPGERMRFLAGATGALGPALLLLGLIAHWQNQDPVYRATASGVLGDHQLSVFWYPITFGGVLLLAMRGWVHWIREARPARVAVGAWTLAVMFVHTSPLINGYHFVFQLPLPVCIVAAVALIRLCDRFRGGNGLVRFGILMLLLLTFHSPLAVTWRAAKRAVSYQVPRPIMEAISQLARDPRGNVFTSPHIGTFIPAYTSHRVYVGHWFLTPAFDQKQAQFLDVMEGRVDPRLLLELLRAEKINYVLLPPSTPPAVLEALQLRAARISRFGEVWLFHLP